MPNTLARLGSAVHRCRVPEALLTWRHLSATLSVQTPSADYYWLFVHILASFSAILIHIRQLSSYHTKITLQTLRCLNPEIQNPIQSLKKWSGELESNWIYTQGLLPFVPAVLRPLNSPSEAKSKKENDHSIVGKVFVKKLQMLSTAHSNMVLIYPWPLGRSL